MEKMNLSIDTGSVRIAINDNTGAEIGFFTFIPTDTDIIKRFNDVAANVESYTLGDDPKAEDVVKLSDMIKSQFDLLMNGEVSENIFQKCSPLTLLPNGNFFFESVLEGIAGLIEKTTNQRVDKKLARVRAATAKYHK